MFGASVWVVALLQVSGAASPGALLVQPGELRDELNGKWAGAAMCAVTGPRTAGIPAASQDLATAFVRQEIKGSCETVVAVEPPMDATTPGLVALLKKSRADVLVVVRIKAGAGPADIEVELMGPDGKTTFRASMRRALDVGPAAVPPAAPAAAAPAPNAQPAPAAPAAPTRKSAPAPQPPPETAAAPAPPPSTEGLSTHVAAEAALAEALEVILKRKGIPRKGRVVVVVALDDAQPATPALQVSWAQSRAVLQRAATKALAPANVVLAGDLPFGATGDLWGIMRAQKAVGIVVLSYKATGAIPRAEVAAAAVATRMYPMTLQLISERLVQTTATAADVEAAQREWQAAVTDWRTLKVVGAGTVVRGNGVAARGWESEIQSSALGQAVTTRNSNQRTTDMLSRLSVAGVVANVVGATLGVPCAVMGCGGLVCTGGILSGSAAAEGAVPAGLAIAAAGLLGCLLIPLPVLIGEVIRHKLYMMVLGGLCPTSVDPTVLRKAVAAHNRKVAKGSEHAPALEDE